MGKQRPPRSEPSPKSASKSRPSTAKSSQIGLGGNTRRSSGYAEALERYEQGLGALQKHYYQEAAGHFRVVLERFPDEKELHDRARLYLNVCERQEETTPAPETPDERVYAATLALNAGAYDEALSHLHEVLTETPGHDHALYMLAVIQVAKGELDSAIDFLRRAVELNPDNRALARQDPDLAQLRDLSPFREIVDTPLTTRRAGSGRPSRGARPRR